MMKEIFVIILLNLSSSNSLNNGQATLPPMGWSSWLSYGCNVCDYVEYTANCLSEIVIENTANFLVQEGYSNLGYQYIILDDCWQCSFRDAITGRLQPDMKRFPKGIRALAKYVHDKNLKLGIFSDLGRMTGGGRPGSGGFYEIDANTFAEWEVDYVKMSAASALPNNLEAEYTLFWQHLNKTYRPMVYATSVPVYQEYYGLPVNYEKLPDYCNTWRIYGDIQPSWSSILAIMDYYALRQAHLRKNVHSGAWNDADLLVAGMNGITLDQSKAQIAVWAIMASPLILSVNIHQITPDFKAVLQNEHVIAINQDPLRIPGYKYEKQQNIDTWMRPISPEFNKEYSYAVAFVNRDQYSSPVEYKIALKDLGLNYADGYYVTDLFNRKIPSLDNVTYDKTFMKPESILQMKINASGVAFFKVEVAVKVDTIGSLTVAALKTYEPNEIIRYRF